jgi:hypothetical protein
LQIVGICFCSRAHRISWWPFGFLNTPNFGSNWGCSARLFENFECLAPRFGLKSATQNSSTGKSPHQSHADDATRNTLIKHARTMWPPRFVFKSTAACGRLTACKLRIEFIPLYNERFLS